MRIKKTDVLHITEPAGVLSEVAVLLSFMGHAKAIPLVKAMFADAERIFAGKFKGYSSIPGGYNDFSHTTEVFLASARLLHGLHAAARRDASNVVKKAAKELIKGLPGARAIDEAVFHDHKPFSERGTVITLAAALFHDMDFVQKTSARSTDGTERRGIAFAKQYLRRKRISPAEIAACVQMIESLSAESIGSLKFKSVLASEGAKVLITADLMAQLADRRYLEKLLTLYHDMRKTGLVIYGSADEILTQTEHFYNDVARRRMNDELGGLYRVMRGHFSTRWGADRDFYEEYMNKNISYLRRIVQKYGRNYEEHLRRSDDIETAAPKKRKKR